MELPEALKRKAKKHRVRENKKRYGNIGIIGGCQQKIRERRKAFPYLCLYRVAFGADHSHDLVHALAAGVVLRGFHHDAEQRLCAGFAHQNAARVAQLVGHGLHRLLHVRVLPGRQLILHPDVLQHLGIDGQPLRQLAQGQLPLQHHLHQLQAGEDAVAGGGVLGKDDMARLLAAQGAAVLAHILIHGLVAHGGLGIADAVPVEGAVQAEVGHDRGDYGIAGQLTAVLHVLAADVEDMVAGDNIPPLVHCQTAVGIAVVGKAHVQPLFHHELAQRVDVGRAHAVVDIEAVGLVAHDIGGRTQGVEHALGDHPGAAVGAVQTYLLTLEGEHPQGDEVAHVAVAARRVIHRAANVLPPGQGQRRPLLTEQLQLAV